MWIKFQDTFENIADPDPEAYQDPYAVYIRKLDHHFLVEKHVPFERHALTKITSNEGEPVDKFQVFASMKGTICLGVRRKFARPIDQALGLHSIPLKILKLVKTVLYHPLSYLYKLFFFFGLSSR